jgi:type IV pilus assembly protein PilQ
MNKGIYSGVSTMLSMRRGGIVKMANVMLKQAIAVLAVSMLSTAGFAQEAVRLKDVDFSALPGDRFEIRMEFSGQPPEPQGYTIDKPARLVLDFAGVESELTQKKFPLSFGSAKSANVLSDGGRTRLILNMVQLEKYETKVNGNVLTVSVGNSQTAEAFKKSVTLSDKLSTDVSEFSAGINNVDFRRGENGEGRVLITLSDPNVNINVDDQGGKITLNFAGTQLPENLRRKLDVTDFATPVVSVSSEYDGTNAVVTIIPTGDYDYLAYQTDAEYVISVKQLSAKEVEEKKDKFNYVGDKLSLNFQDIPVRSVLQLIADFTELNLVASDTVDGKITLRLENVPWDQALDLVLKTKGLDKRQSGNVLMVAPAAEIAAREREELETRRQLQELAPVRTEFVQILYANAADVFKLFEKGKGGGQGSSTQSILSERGSAIVDERTNSIIITETEEKIEQFRSLVKRIDIPVRQVSIEARIVKATDSFTKELGVRWGIAAFDQGSNRAALLNGSQNNMRTEGSSIRDSMLDGEQAVPINGTVWNTTPGGLSRSLDDAMAVDLAAQNVSATSIALGILDLDHGLLSLELSAMEDNGIGEIVSQPKVVTGDKQKAIIKSGQEVGYQEASSSGATTTTFKEAVLKLEVTPQITPDDRVIMDLEITKDNIADFIGVIPVIDTTELKTRVLVDNGQTVVLGGIFESEKTDKVTKVPFLGDLPIVGALFRHKLNSENRTELLIFVTPRLLQDPLADRR